MARARYSLNQHQDRDVVELKKRLLVAASSGYRHKHIHARYSYVVKLHSSLVYPNSEKNQIMCSVLSYSLYDGRAKNH